MDSHPSTYLLVIGDREALAWIIGEQRMAFPENRARSVAALRPGDNLLLYTTRGCFRSPTIDRGRVIGHASVTSPVVPLDEVVKFGDRTFPVGCTLSIDSLAPFRAGVDMVGQVERMHTFAHPTAWGVYLRRPLVPLDGHDYKLLLDALQPVAVEPKYAIPEYIAHRGSVRTTTK